MHLEFSFNLPFQDGTFMLLMSSQTPGEELS